MTNDAQGIEEREDAAELPLADALSFAIQLHRTGHVDAAETLYRRILEVDPDQPDALHFLGVASLHRGRIDAALELIEKSIALDPSADCYNNLGNVLLAANRAEEATEAYRKAISLAPFQADAHTNLGTILKAQRRFDEAAQAYDRALELDPEHVEAHNNYGNLFAAQGDVRKAIVCYSKAITLRPHHSVSRKYLGLAYCTLGQNDKAAEIYREWLELEPEHPGAKHLLAACSGRDVPGRASDAYIETTFDAFAQTFDAKLAHLEYRAPQLVTDALAKAIPTSGKSLIVLDAGCGTGLCGPLVAAYASRLCGVDLSARMLDQARNRAVYDELSKDELTAFLESHSNVFDVIISADTLIYFGELAPVFDAAFGALRPGGLLIFTAEDAGDEMPDGYRINPHGRYSHSEAYLAQTLARCGFGPLVFDRADLRMERGVPVRGLVTTARKARTMEQKD